MSRTIVLELFLPFRLFKKTANIRCTTTSAQILNSHENKTKWRVALKRKTGAAAKHLLIGHLADWSMEPLNHRTIEPKIAQEYGLLPADARQQLYLLHPPLKKRSLICIAASLLLTMQMWSMNSYNLWKRCLRQTFSCSPKVIWRTVSVNLRREAWNCLLTT